VVRAAYRRIAEVARPEVWISLRSQESALAEAEALDVRVAAGETLPLAGHLVAVKDNIDVIGFDTTAACPEFAYAPAATATAVQRLVDAGAIVIGKTNLDQFATGLVGTRSPYGAVRHATMPDHVSGGSSSGSATAVALGIVTIGIGTDTAGSGRVPASFNGLVGIKPTLGLVPNTGLVAACRSYDAITTFAADLRLAQQAISIMTGPDPADPRSRVTPAGTRLALPARPVVAVPTAAGLEPLTPEGRAAFESAVTRLRSTGCEVREIVIEPLLEAALLLYDGAIVAERYAAAGAFLDKEPPGADPIVSRIIRAAGAIPAWQYVNDQEQLDRARLDALRLLEGCDALMLPTVPEHPTLAAVEADPIGVNGRLGTYTNFLNLLDLFGIAVPAGESDGSPFGVTFVARPFDDQAGYDLAALFLGEQGAEPTAVGVPLAVFGAHLRGQPLNGELQALGARFVEDIRTSDAYRLFALATTPAKPGLVRTGDGTGAPVDGELWALSPSALGTFLSRLPAPMGLAPVTLEDGRVVTGFSCAQDATDGAADITGHGGWRQYLASR